MDATATVDQAQGCPQQQDQQDQQQQPREPTRKSTLSEVIDESVQVSENVLKVMTECNTLVRGTVNKARQVLTSTIDILDKETPYAITAVTAGTMDPGDLRKMKSARRHLSKMLDSLSYISNLPETSSYKGLLREFGSSRVPDDQ